MNQLTFLLLGLISSVSISNYIINQGCETLVYCEQLGVAPNSGRTIDLSDSNNWRIFDSVSQENTIVEIFITNCEGSYKFTKKHYDNIIKGEYTATQEPILDTVYFLNDETYEFDFKVLELTYPERSGVWEYYQKDIKVKTIIYKNGVAVDSTTHTK